MIFRCEPVCSSRPKKPIKIDRSLVALRAQLTDDLKDLDQVIDYRSRQQELYLLLTKLLSDQEIDEQAYAEAYTEVLDLNRTFFPDGSRFESIRDPGYLPEIENADLQLQLSHLFEQVHRRQSSICAHTFHSVIKLLGKLLPLVVKDSGNLTNIGPLARSS